MASSEVTTALPTPCSSVQQHIFQALERILANRAFESALPQGILINEAALDLALGAAQ